MCHSHTTHSVLGYRGSGSRGNTKQHMGLLNLNVLMNDGGVPARLGNIPVGFAAGQNVHPIVTKDHSGRRGQELRLAAIHTVPP